jgi:hypothetical protein
MGYGVWTVDTTFTDIELSEFEQGLYRNHVACETHSTFNNKTTVSVIKLKSGFEIVGTSGCEDPSKFSEDLGRQYALKDALKKLGEFLAFHRAQATYLGEMTELRQVREVSPEVIEEIRKATLEGVAKFASVMNDPTRPPGMRGF